MIDLMPRRRIKEGDASKFSDYDGSKTEGYEKFSEDEFPWKCLVHGGACERHLCLGWADDGKEGYCLVRAYLIKKLEGKK